MAKDITLKFPVKCNGKIYLPGEVIASDHPAYSLLKKHSVEHSEVRDYGGEPNGAAVAKAYKQVPATKKPAKAEDKKEDGAVDQKTDGKTSDTTKPLSKMNKEELIAVATAKGLVQDQDFTSDTTNKDLIALIEG